MRKKNNLKRRLAEGQAVLGTWSVLPSSSVANVICAAGFDFLIIDMEHGPSGFDTAEDIVRACEVEDATPLVRVSENKASLILRALEVGSHGVVVPQITSDEEARAALRAIKYGPEGERGFSPFTRSGGYTHENASSLPQRENAATLCILLVEGMDGIQNLDEILEVSGIDVIYLGTYDLSQSAGYPGQADHPEVVAFVEGCVKKIRAKKVAAGCLAQNQSDVRRWREIGIQFIPYIADCALLYHACRDVRNLFDK